MLRKYVEKTDRQTDRQTDRENILQMIIQLHSFLQLIQILFAFTHKSTTESLCLLIKEKL